MFFFSIINAVKLGDWSTVYIYKWYKISSHTVPLAFSFWTRCQWNQVIRWSIDHILLLLFFEYIIYYYITTLLLIKYYLVLNYWFLQTFNLICGSKYRYDLEAHLVHMSNDGEVAVIGVMYEIGETPDPLLSLVNS